MSKILVDKVVLEQALEALETNNQAWKNLADSGDAGFWEADEQPFYETSVKAITALRTALAKPVQEPVAWTLTRTLTERKTTTNGYLWFSDPVNSSWTPLYTAPPQRESLTEEQKLDLVTNWFSEDWAIEKALDLLDDYDIECARVIGE